jgi:PKD repeat protein
VVYENPGVYSVTLIVSNGAGSDTLALINYLTIGTTPTVGFSSAVSGLTVTFTNSSSGATSYLWSFGDGNSSTESNPVHTYLSEGSFTVVLTATNACGNSSVTQVSTVVGPPTASFSAPQTTGCAPFQVTFVNTSSSNSTSFLWQFAGGTPATSTEQTPTVVYETPGVYSVSLTATNASGSSSSTQNNYITVLGAPNAGFTSTANGSTVNFTNTSTGGTAYAWNFGDGGSSTAFEPTHVYADGTYTAVLTVTNDCGTSTFTAQIVVATPPTAAFNASTNSGCAPLTVVFNNTSSANATTFNWSFPGGTPASSTEINPTVVYAQAGVFTATLTATNAQGSSTTNTTITVGAQPAPSFTFLVAGNTVTFTNTSNNAVSYFWEFGDGQVSNATNPVHTYIGSGTYNVLLTASNPCGAVKFTQTIVLAGEVPVAAFSGTPTSGCAPLTVAFTDQSTGGPTNWAWTFLGGNPPSSNIQNPTVTYAVPGTYPVSLTVGNAFGNNSTTFSNYIAVGGLPAAAFNFSTNGGVVTFSNVSFNGLSFTWNFGDGNSSNEASPVHVYTQSGTYTVSLTATNPCGASTLTQVITVVITGVETGNWLELLRVFPNPNDGNFQVEMKGYGSDEVEFTLFNSLGGQIQRDVADFSSGSLLHTFRNGNLPAAVYTLRVRSGNQISNIKIVIQ